MLREDLLASIEFILERVSLDEDEKQLLAEYHVGTKDVDVAKMLGLNGQYAVRSKRQNINSKIGSAVIKLKRTLADIENIV